jgi:hypothetical protein
MSASEGCCIRKSAEMDGVECEGPVKESWAFGATTNGTEKYLTVARLSPAACAKHLP